METQTCWPSANILLPLAIWIAASWLSAGTGRYFLATACKALALTAAADGNVSAGMATSAPRLPARQLSAPVPWPRLALELSMAVLWRLSGVEPGGTPLTLPWASQAPLPARQLYGRSKSSHLRLILSRAPLPSL